ncbi:MAG TPA: DNA primase [Syntrophobacteraceae bacterium]|nr:DNA primase [Syntrophobacteraceae bacterium]
MVNKRFSAGHADAVSLVKDAADIVDVVGQVVKLRRVGNRYLGLCPFHQEKTPSFQVDSQNQLFYCFGCGVGGDVLSFVTKAQNLSFGEALEFLADRYHIQLPSKDPLHQSGEGKKESPEYHQALAAAADFFYGQLHHSAAGQIARRYVEQRGLPARVVQEQRIGYAPNQWDGLLNHLRKAGIDQRVGIETGLLVASSSDRIYDRFRQRLMFPITDDRGRVVAFGGRSLDGAEPKYLNSPETVLYHKGRMLYNLVRAREACRQVRQVVLVEGYLDLLAFHACGFYRVAATLGTALTAQQVRLLTRVADEVVLLYDGDEAGQRAMFRAAPLFLEEGLAVTCPRLPAGMDPDDFLKDQGLAGFEELLKQREDLGKVAMDDVLSGWDGTTAGKVSVIERLQPLFDAVRQPVVRAEYLQVVGERLGLAESVVQSQLQHKRRAPSDRTMAQAPPGSMTSDGPHPQAIEENILRVVVRYPCLISKLKESGAVEHFREGRLRAVAQALTELDPDREPSSAGLCDRLADSELQSIVARLMMQEDPYGDLEAACLYFGDRLATLKQRQVRQSRKDLLQSIGQAERDGDRQKLQNLLQQFQESCQAPGIPQPNESS